MKDLLADFFATVDKIAAKEKKKEENKLKKYIPKDDNPIKKEPREPLYVALFWTKTTCRCGAVHSHPTYPGHSAYVYYPNLKKKGIAEYIPVHTFDAFSRIPHREIWSEETTNVCPSCFSQAHIQIDLFPVETLELPKEFQKLDVPKIDLPEPDIRQFLEDPDELALEECLLCP